MSFKKTSTLFFIYWLTILTTQGQNSPFSSIGIGNIRSNGYIAQDGLAGAGIALSNPLYVNNLNPALLTANRQFIFEVGVSGQLQQLSDDQFTQQDFAANLGYFGLLLPLSKKWSGQIGLKPYSTVEYEINTSEPIPGSDFNADYTYIGSGGLNSFFFSNGVNVGKNLNLGLKINYIFGALETESISQVRTGGFNTNVVSFERLNVGDLIFTPAISYTYPLNDKTNLSAGIVYDVGVQANTRQFRSVERRDPLGGPLSIDTLVVDEATSIFLPQKLQAGLAYEKRNRWAIAADFTWQPWQEYRESDEEVGLQNTIGVALGGQYTPDFGAVKGLFKRATYRVGVRYQQLPIEVNGNQVNDVGINFGTSLPIGVNQLATTYLHLGFAVGQRGSLSENDLQERYIQFSLGASLSDLLWFRRPKIN